MPTPNPANMLVTTAWLAEHQNDRDLVMLHVGSKAQYDSGHMVGARHTSLDDVSLPTVPGGLTLQLAGAEQLTAWAVRNGIGDRTRVIVIPHDGALQSATRVFITLAYLGAMDRISLMNGGYQAWKSESRTGNDGRAGRGAGGNVHAEAAPGYHRHHRAGGSGHEGQHAAHCRRATHAILQR